MENGRTTMEAPADELLDDDSIIEAYLGVS
jgi:ABC-type branched-subunit amino acid transport system ATPase component